MVIALPASTGLAALTDRALAGLIAERIMGRTLDWTHAELRLLAAQHPATKAGRGIFLACDGCGLRGYSQELVWPERCPTPPYPAYPTDLAVAWSVVEQMLRCPPAPDAAYVFGRWFDAAHIWVLSAPAAARAICEAALRAAGASEGAATNPFAAMTTPDLEALDQAVRQLQAEGRWATPG